MYVFLMSLGPCITMPFYDLDILHVRTGFPIIVFGSVSSGAPGSRQNARQGLAPPSESGIVFVPKTQGVAYDRSAIKSYFRREQKDEADQQTWFRKSDRCARCGSCTGESCGADRQCPE